MSKWTSRFGADWGTHTDCSGLRCLKWREPSRVCSRRTSRSGFRTMRSFCRASIEAPLHRSRSAGQAFDHFAGGSSGERDTAHPRGVTLAFLSECEHQPRSSMMGWRCKSATILRMAREVFLLCDGALVWHGLVSGAGRGAVATTRDLFEEAWRLALQAKAVSPDDAGRVQFRFSSP